MTHVFVAPHPDDLLLIEQHDEWTQRSDGPVVFVPLVGEAGYTD